ncbi:cation:proton antiporter [Acuticoccus sp.]|uniref:cation:proton antiporter domain-containing protein n=1 Tax=Acuticoccus sp. TaxID=1904378 RepID=UPI003B51FE60
MNLTIGICAVAVIALGLVSATIERAPLSTPLLAFAIGLAVGPQALGLIDPAMWPNSHAIVMHAAGITLAISVTGIALRTPIGDYARVLRPVALLVTVGMVLMWLASAGLAVEVLGVPLLAGLAIGAVLAPTDPVVASSIVTGEAAERALPGRTRSTLSLESGANDGLAYAIVLLPVALLTPGDGDLWRQWVWDALVVGIAIAVLLGALAGAAAGALLSEASHVGWVQRHSLFGMSVALSLGALALATFAGSDGILAAFAAGVAFRFIIDRQDERSEGDVQETIANLVNLPIFVLFGAALPVAAWLERGPQLLLFAVLILLVRRPLSLLVLRPALGAGLARPDVAFLGWFGPMGVAAMYYALLVREETGDATAWEVTSAVVAASLVAHGVTSGPGLVLYEWLRPRRASAGAAAGASQTAMRRS